MPKCRFWQLVAEPLCNSIYIRVDIHSCNTMKTLSCLEQCFTNLQSIPVLHSKFAWQPIEHLPTVVIHVLWRSWLCISSWPTVMRSSCECNKICSSMTTLLLLTLTALMANISYNQYRFPDADDFSGAATALRRLQDTYKLSPSLISSGKLGSTSAVAMTCEYHVTVLLQIIFWSSARIPIFTITFTFL